MTLSHARRHDRGDVRDPPLQVQRILGGRSAVPVWRNELAGVTWQIGDGDQREFLKVGPVHPEFDVASDVERLRWLVPYVPVPVVLGADVEDGVAWTVRGMWMWGRSEARTGGRTWLRP